MLFQRLMPEAIKPSKANKGDAGWDLYTPRGFVLMPAEVALIPLGLKIQLPAHSVGILKGRSGLAKSGIEPMEFYNPEGEMLLGGVIDCDYRGEWGVILKNLGNVVREFKAGDRIAQFVHLLLHQDEEMREVVVLPSDTERGTGGFGASGD